MSDDVRSTEAKARDDWFESDDGKKACDGTAQGQYLQNRLAIASSAGIDAGRALAASERPLSSGDPVDDAVALHMLVGKMLDVIETLNACGNLDEDQKVNAPLLMMFNVVRDKQLCPQQALTIIDARHLDEDYKG